MEIGDKEIEIKNNHLVFRFDFDQDIISQIKSIGMRWRPARKFWYAKATKVLIQSFLKLFPEFYNELKDLAPKNIDCSDYVPSDYLMVHQEKAAVIAKEKLRYCWWHGIGTGKSALGIELMKQKDIKTLVVCPLSILEETWMEEIKKWDPERLQQTVNLWALKQKNSPKARRLFIKGLDECKTAIINFESFRSIQEDLEQADFRMLLIDESTCIKNNRSKITEAILEFSENMDFVYPLSGNPAPNSEEEYWSQTQLIDPALFGKSFYAFRNKYFFSHGYGNFKWSMKKDMREEFLTKLASISDVVRKEDAVDLPEKTENIRKVYLNTLERKAYEEMKKHLVIEFGDKEVIAVNAGVKLMKLREGTSGFYINQDEEIIPVGNSKLNELEKLLEEIGNSQVIIWTHFHYEADQIEKLFGEISKKRNISWSRVDGTIKSREIKNQRIREFKKKGFQYLVAHPGSLGRGHNLANCTYMIFFSISHSHDFFDQCSGRIYRKGQNNKCSFYFLIADCSVDEIILKTVLAKGNVVEAVFRYIKEGR
jgi:SNF2 family DNA or RNA helicase